MRDWRMPKRLLVVFALLLATAWVAIPAPSTAEIRVAPTTFLTDSDGITEFELYKNGIYWWQRMWEETTPTRVVTIHPGTIRLRGTMGGSQKSVMRSDQILTPISNSTENHGNVAHDGQYVYFFSQGLLHRKSLNLAEGTSSQPMPGNISLATGENSAYIELSGGQLYWANHTVNPITLQMTNYVYSMPTNGNQSSLLFSSPGSGRIAKIQRATYRQADGTDVEALFLLTADGRLLKIPLNPSGSEQLLDMDVWDFAIHHRAWIGGAATDIYAVTSLFTEGSLTPPSPGELVRIDAETNLATRLRTASGTKQFLAVTTDSDSGATSPDKNVYVVEAAVNCGELVGCTIGGPYEVSRHKITVPVDSGAWDTFVIQISGIGSIRSDDQTFYFVEYGGSYDSIMMLPTDAAPVELDFQADYMEVTQGIQNMAGAVPLVGGKETYVRGWGSITNTTGDNGWRPYAVIHGYRNGQELADSPIDSRNFPYLSDTSSLAYDRPSLNHSYYFRLPETWTQAGNLTLAFEISPSPAETGTLPNTVTKDVTFQSVPRPCIVGMPIAAQATPFFNQVGIADWRFADILDRFRTLFPIGQFSFHYIDQPIYKTSIDLEVLCLPDVPIIWPPFCAPFPVISYSQFDMSLKDEWSEALGNVAQMAVLSNLSGYQPGNCDPTTTHWVAMLHPVVLNGAWAGLGYRPGNSSIVTMTTSQPSKSYTYPRGGQILAHELAHNHGRKHINCGSGILGPFDNPPWASCNLGPNDTQEYYGFDGFSFPPSIIAPNPAAVADLMTYFQPKWTSSFTWNAILGTTLPVRRAVWLESGEGRRASELLTVSGTIWPQQATVQANPFYRIPATPLTRARAARYAPTGVESRTVSYDIRLLDARGLELYREALVLSAGEEPLETAAAFSRTLTFDPNTAYIEIVDANNTTLLQRAVTSSAPLLTLQGVTVNDTDQTVELRWISYDPDNDVAPVFTIQYSTDDGLTWQPVALNYELYKIVLNASMLPGSDTARLQVLATDGVNTTIAMSQQFSLPKHAPRPLIGGITEGERLDFAIVPTLSGYGLDAEDGTVDGTGLSWAVTGPVALSGTGRSFPLPDLLPGEYTAVLTAIDSDGQSGMATRHFEVLPVAVPDTAVPELDGRCTDTAYTDATLVRLLLSSGRFVRGWMLHANGALYLCFSDLPFASAGGSPLVVGIRVDGDKSGDGVAQAGDMGFFVDEEGIPYQLVGDGAGAMPISSTPAVGFEAVVEWDTASWDSPPQDWSAEMEISESLVNGWDHAAGIMFDYAKPLDSAGTTWPAGAGESAPSTWASAWFGTPPAPENRPPVANPGIDETLLVPQDRTIYLDGGSSYDPDGNPLSYTWIQTAGPTVTLLNPDSSTPSFVASPVSEPTVLEFELIVSDGTLSSVAARIRVTLLPASRVPETTMIPAWTGTLGTILLLGLLAFFMASRRRRYTPRV